MTMFTCREEQGVGAGLQGDSATHQARQPRRPGHLPREQPSGGGSPATGLHPGRGAAAQVPHVTLPRDLLPKDLGALPAGVDMRRGRADPAGAQRVTCGAPSRGWTPGWPALGSPDAHLLSPLWSAAFAELGCHLSRGRRSGIRLALHTGCLPCSDHRRDRHHAWACPVPPQPLTPRSLDSSHNRELNPC